MGNVICEMCDHINSDNRDGKVVSKCDFIEIVMMDAVLSRALNAPRHVTGKETVDTPVKFRAEQNIWMPELIRGFVPLSLWFLTVLHIFATVIGGTGVLGKQMRLFPWTHRGYG